jgi:hypothetical protein
VEDLAKSIRLYFRDIALINNSLASREIQKLALLARNRQDNCEMQVVGLWY